MILVLRGKGGSSMDQLEEDDVLIIPILKPIIDESAVDRLRALCGSKRRLGVVMSSEAIAAVAGRVDISNCIETVIAVGPSTCGAVHAAFPTVKCEVPSEYFSGAVSKMLEERCGPGEEVLVIRSKDYVDDAEIRAGMCSVVEIGLYELARDDEAIRRAASYLPSAGAVVFTSPKVFTTFLEAVGGKALEGKRLVAIGPTTGSTMRRNGFEPLIPARYTVKDAVELAARSSGGS
ncbi:uroporphyrinogen-III synthase [Thermocladium modestius]|nr:uroporphyrinogen-III synthase [Thermocladium modestius]